MRAAVSTPVTARLSATRTNLGGPVVRLPGSVPSDERREPNPPINPYTYGAHYSNYVQQTRGVPLSGPRPPSSTRIERVLGTRGVGGDLQLAARISGLGANTGLGGPLDGQVPRSMPGRAGRRQGADTDGVRGASAARINARQSERAARLMNGHRGAVDGGLHVDRRTGQVFRLKLAAPFEPDRMPVDVRPLRARLAVRAPAPDELLPDDEPTARPALGLHEDLTHLDRHTHMAQRTRRDLASRRGVQEEHLMLPGTSGAQFLSMRFADELDSIPVEDARERLERSARQVAARSGVDGSLPGGQRAGLVSGEYIGDRQRYEHVHEDEEPEAIAPSAGRVLGVRGPVTRDLATRWSGEQTSVHEEIVRPARAPSSRRQPERDLVDLEQTRSARHRPDVGPVERHATRHALSRFSLPDGLRNDVQTAAEERIADLQANSRR